MTFAELLQQKKDAIADRWLADALATYPTESAAAFERQKDPFANPVGHSLRVGTRAVLETLLDGGGPEKIRQHLLEIIRIRAVQQFPPSRSLAFLFSLKKAIRAELGPDAADPRRATDLAGLEAEIDGLVLAAFDVFAQCREQVHELRINEVKRSVSWVMQKLNQRGRASEPGGSI